MFKALHDKISISEKLASLSDYEFRIWVMGLAKSDSYGRIYGDARLLKATALPLLDSRLDQVQAALATLAQRGLVHAYEVEGKAFLVFHDHDQAGTGNLRYRKSSIPAPPSSLCRCIQLEGESLTAVKTAVRTAVNTAVVHVPSPVHVQEGVVGGGDTPPPRKPPPPVVSAKDESMRQLFALAKQQSILAKDDTLTNYLAGWLRRLGSADKLHEKLMDPIVVGKTVIEIQDWLFPKVAQKALAPAPKNFKCGVCNDTGKVVSGYQDHQAVFGECSCRRRRAL